MNRTEKKETGISLEYYEVIGVPQRKQQASQVQLWVCFIPGDTVTDVIINEVLVRM